MSVPYLGLDVGGTKILAVVVDAHGRIERRAKVSSRREEGAEAVFARIVELARAMIDRSPEIAAIGAGFAGLVDPTTGTVRSSIMLSGWDGFPLAARLAEAAGRPTFVHNDAKAAGWGEYRALGSPHGLHMVVLAVGTGIGGAFILDGRLYLGAAGLAGEVGNTTIEREGPVCWCGNRGCLNMLASGSALAEHASRAAALDSQSTLHGAGAALTVEAIAAAARRGDILAARVIEDGAAALGAGIANVVNMLNPHRVALTGGVVELGETFFDRVRAEVRARAFAEIVEGLVIAPSTLGYETGAYGAACLAADAWKANHGRGDRRRAPHALGRQTDAAS
jgi:glucokinase